MVEEPTPAKKKRGYDLVALSVYMLKFDVTDIAWSEDCTLPHMFRRNPADSTPGLFQCDKGQIGMFSPGVVRQTLPDSGGISRI